MPCVIEVSCLRVCVGRPRDGPHTLRPVQVSEPERSVGATAGDAEVQPVPPSSVLLAGVSAGALGSTQGGVQQG